jgi:NAD(P)-dependent dehydrogenase (short-subunit alcohol dehydrogenase family)
MDPKGKIAVVTGASSGIGLAVCGLLTARGAKAALIARTQDELEAISRSLPGSFPLAADLSDERAARAAFKDVLAHYGRVDILVNNAGRSYAATVEDMDTEKLRTIFSLNVMTPVALMQEAAEAMVRGGVIVNISSGTVLREEPFPAMSAYVSSKHALTSLSRTAREELKSRNIIVSTVYPYLTATDFFKNEITDVLGPRAEEDPDLSGADSPEEVAETVLRAIITGAAELYQHGWMEPKRDDPPA